MGLRRWLLGCLLAAALAGCTSTDAVILEDGSGGSGLAQFGGTGIFVEVPGEGGEPPGAFLPAEWREVWPEEERDAAGDGSIARRPVRRGGSGQRGPSPLLNPKPTPNSARYWRQRPADTRVVEETRQLYYLRLAEAQERYPNLTGYQEHHVVPVYLGGPKSGQTYRLHTAYHQVITQEFRQQWPYGQRTRPDTQDLMRIMIRVYQKYPIPQLVGIEP